MSDAKYYECLIDTHLDWSDKQRRILSANGQAESYFHSYDESELPHFHLLNSDTRSVFEEWRRQDYGSTVITEPSIIAGAWTRVLFHGGWDFSTHLDEVSLNLQSNTLFIDLRIPTTRNVLLKNANATSIRSVDQLTAEQLRYYARQHVFAGYSQLHRHHAGVNENEDHPVSVMNPLQRGRSSSSSNEHTYAFSPYPWSCTRHHVMDWNFVGVPRSRPNKWWIQPQSPCSTSRRAVAPIDEWKEWAYATDSAGQYYYCEHWKRTCPSSTNDSRLVLRRSANAQGYDGILIVIGNEFNYCLSQRPTVDSSRDRERPSSLVDLVDDAVQRGDLETARTWLRSMLGGHGIVHAHDDNPKHNSWRIDTAIEFWREGSSLLLPGEVTVSGTTIEDCVVRWKGEPWTVFESSFDSLERLLLLFNCLHMRRRAKY
jgi:hypothetical protein